MANATAGAGNVTAFEASMASFGAGATMGMIHAVTGPDHMCVSGCEASLRMLPFFATFFGGGVTAARCD